MDSTSLPFLLPWPRLTLLIRRILSSQWHEATWPIAKHELVRALQLRSALERAGVPRSAAMKMFGHRTESIYRRYAIADEAMLREAGAKLSALHDAQRTAPRTVLPLSTGTIAGTVTASGGL